MKYERDPIFLFLLIALCEEVIMKLVRLKRFIVVMCCVFVSFLFLELSQAMAAGKEAKPSEEIKKKSDELKALEELWENKYGDYYYRLQEQLADIDIKLEDFKLQLKSIQSPADRAKLEMQIKAAEQQDRVILERVREPEGMMVKMENLRDEIARLSAAEGSGAQRDGVFLPAPPPRFVQKTETNVAPDPQDYDKHRDEYIVMSIAAQTDIVTKDNTKYRKLKNTDTVAIVLRMRGKDSIVSGYDAVTVLLDRGYLTQVPGVGLVFTSKSPAHMADAGSAAQEQADAGGEYVSCQEFAKCAAQLGDKINSPLDKNKDPELYWQVIICRNKRTACDEAKKRGEEQKKLTAASPQGSENEPNMGGLERGAVQETGSSQRDGLLGKDFNATLVGQGPSNSAIFKPVGSTTPTVKDFPGAQAQPAVVPDTAQEPYDSSKEWNP